jgi:hypothetical protein
LLRDENRFSEKPATNAGWRNLFVNGTSAGDWLRDCFKQKGRPEGIGPGAETI